MIETQLHELLFGLVETRARRCPRVRSCPALHQNEDLRGDWEKCHDETKHHLELAEEIVRGFSLDPSTETPRSTRRAPYRQVTSWAQLHVSLLFT
jgi:hypothetical protein